MIDGCFGLNLPRLPLLSAIERANERPFCERRLEIGKCEQIASNIYK
jgi:hypothetical protein